MVHGIRSLLTLPCLLCMGFASRKRVFRLVRHGWRVPLVGFHGSIASSRWHFAGWRPPGAVSKV